MPDDETTTTVTETTTTTVEEPAPEPPAVEPQIASQSVTVVTGATGEGEDTLWKSRMETDLQELGARTLSMETTLNSILLKLSTEPEPEPAIEQVQVQAEPPASEAENPEPPKARRSLIW